MTLDVVIPRGTTHDIKVTVTGKDLTGASAICTFVTAHGLTPTLVKRSVGGGITVTSVLITDDDGVTTTNSIVSVHLYPIDGDTLTSIGPPYYYQLRVTHTGVQEMIESGTLILTVNDTYEVV